MSDEQRDFLHGIQAIADHLGVSYRQVQHMMERDKLPTFDLAGRVCSRRSTLAKWFSEREAAALKAPKS